MSSSPANNATLSWIVLARLKKWKKSSNLISVHSNLCGLPGQQQRYWVVIECSWNLSKRITKKRVGKYTILIHRKLNYYWWSIPSHPEVNTIQWVLRVRRKQNKALGESLEQMISSKNSQDYSQITLHWRGHNLKNYHRKITTSLVEMPQSLWLIHRQ